MQLLSVIIVAKFFLLIFALNAYEEVKALLLLSSFAQKNIPKYLSECFPNW